MIDLMLRFGSEGEAIALVPPPDDAFLVDIIGIIRKPIQQWTNDGTQVLRAVPGWHVNVRCTDNRNLSLLEPFAVTPEQPARVWA